MTYCPTGYTTTNQVCVIANTAYIFYILLNQIQDVVTDTIGSYQVSTGADTSFYPTYGSADPMASQRGYYFKGTSYMSLPPNYADSSNSIVFAPVLSVSTWVRYLSSGTILIKQSNSSPYTSSLKLEIAAGYPKITILLNNLGTTTAATYTCANTLTTTAWHQIGFTLTITTATYINCIQDAIAQGSQLLGSYLLIDYTNNYKITIGATYGSSYSNFYTGYIYSMKI